MCQSTKVNLEHLTGIKFTDMLNKYLRFKLCYGHIKKEDFLEIYDNVARKLTSWKDRILNKPGRVTLANIVLTSKPSYNMQVQWFLPFVCAKLNSTMMNFICMVLMINPYTWWVGRKLLIRRKWEVWEFTHIGFKMWSYWVNLCGVSYKWKISFRFLYCLTSI